MSKKYYIYHIPNVKIGCTDNVERRVKKQGYSNFEILEIHNDIYKVSDREIELQKQYGYPVDKTPYYKTVLIATKESRIKGGKIGIEAITKEIRIKAGKTTMKKMKRKTRSKGGKTSGVMHIESGHMKRMREKAVIARKKPILQYHKDGTFIKEWDSGIEAANKLNLHATSITRVCKGGLKTTGGFIFKYKD